MKHSIELAIGSVGIEVSKIDEAEVGLAVPLKHGIDRLAQFGIVGFVDAARIYPDVVKPASLGLTACALDLCPALGRSARGDVVEGLKVDLFAVPGMREDSKGNWRASDELLHSQRAVATVDQSHLVQARCVSYC